jgi:hypothetical protein
MKTAQPAAQHLEKTKAGRYFSVKRNKIPGEKGLLST